MRRSRYSCKKQKKTWQAKNPPIRNLQTLKPFFWKTTKFWEKFIRTKVVEREISDHHKVLPFSLAFDIHKIFVKNKNKFWALKAQLSGHKFSSKFTYHFFYAHSNSPLKISRRPTQFEKNYRIRKQAKNRPIKTL